MLQACYQPDNKYNLTPSRSLDDTTEPKHKNKFIFFHISMYVVADKYDAPKIREYAADRVTKLLTLAFNTVKDLSASSALIQVIDLRGILDKVYEHTGHRNMEEPLRKAVLRVVMGHPATRPLSMRKPGVLVSEIVKIAESIPDFGRDMFLQTMGTVPSLATLPTFLDVVEEVTCSRCSSSSMKLCRYYVTRCIVCGEWNKWK
ncbi:hypothetical protein BKA66DRAFT_467030 [Pyrenochaeta sp. MPI-SDFR-AT-0127]|nr:hypothetical protein BKA66DRAFT_467030 [Pyrenochaeta sp. MPI-SDFR-AT-0127]